MPKIHAKKQTNGTIWLTFDYDPAMVQQVKTIPGRKFIGVDKPGGPAWQVPLDLVTGRELSKLFGTNVVWHQNIREWAEDAIARERNLQALAHADSAALVRLPGVLPALWRAVLAGPLGKGLGPQALDTLISKNPEGSFQTADVGYLASAMNPLNGNQPGMGKTIETIAAIFEAAEDDGPHLVLAPLTSLETVWYDHLVQWQPHPVWLCTGDAYDRNQIIWDFLGTEGPGWLICNHHMAQMNRKKDREDADKVKYFPKYPDLYDLEWNTVILDEVHKAGFRDTKSLLYRGINALTSKKRMALSGTPVGGKPINLWHILHWLEPDTFSNKWNWAEQWLNIDSNGFGKQIGNIRKGLEDEFYAAHAPYFLRRLKSEVLTWLPPKDPVSIWVEMDGRQKKQYDQMAQEAEVRIEDESLTAFGILAEYTRLKQFAISACNLGTKYVKGERKLLVEQTEESCKLAALEEILEERGIFLEKGEEDTVKESVVIFSQFSTVIEMVYAWLANKGVNAVKLTGQTKAGAARTEVQRIFQNREAHVICMTTTAGGVAIELDVADTVVFMDETWDPDDQEQAADRVHRGSKTRQVTVYTIRTKNTIEDYILRVNNRKTDVNKTILDLRRQGLRANMIAAVEAA